MKVSWKKVSGASGYQIRYSTKKSMKGAKKKNASKKYSSKTIGKLKSKKKYYFQVRAYKKSGNQTAYGSWSSMKNKKVK
jgi:minor extracellular protease Epr